MFCVYICVCCVCLRACVCVFVHVCVRGVLRSSSKGDNLPPVSTVCCRGDNCGG